MVKSEQDVREFENLEQQLHSMLREMSELSKKKANDGVNKFKLKLINILLAKLNQVLASSKPFADFEEFNEADVPTNSDVVVMLSQYVGAVFRFRTLNTEYSAVDSSWAWHLEGGKQRVKTASAPHFKYEGK